MAPDPTSQKGAEKAGSLSPQQKVDTVLALTKELPTAMFTSHATDGKLASRAMIPATVEGLVFSFFFNKDSGKTGDLERSPDVNISYLNQKTGDWVSISGKAKINSDRTKVKKHWNDALKSWFDDKKDGTHTGDENDPRVALIDVTPEEIHLFKADGKLSYLFETTKAVFSGEAASGGKMIVIDHDEIQLVSQVHRK